MITCKKTIILSVSNIEAITEGELYNISRQVNSDIWVINNQGDEHHFSESDTEKFFQAVNQIDFTTCT